MQIMGRKQLRITESLPAITMAIRVCRKDVDRDSETEKQMLTGLVPVSESGLHYSTASTHQDLKEISVEIQSKGPGSKSRVAKPSTLETVSDAKRTKSVANVQCV